MSLSKFGINPGSLSVPNALKLVYKNNYISHEIFKTYIF